MSRNEQKIRISKDLHNSLLGYGVGANLVARLIVVNVAKNSIVLQRVKCSQTLDEFLSFSFAEKDKDYIQIQKMQRKSKISFSDYVRSAIKNYSLCFEENSGVDFNIDLAKDQS